MRKINQKRIPAVLDVLCDNFKQNFRTKIKRNEHDLIQTTQTLR